MDIIRNLSNQLVKIIKESCPPSRQVADYDCIANNGCDKNSIVKVGRNGDFFGFTIKVLERIKPLFTDNLIIKGIELISIEEYDSVVRLFDIRNEYIEYGYDIIFYTIYKWFEICKLNIPLTYNIKIMRCDSIIKRLLTVRHDTINVPIEIVNIGNNVVPSEWIGKQFSSGIELHEYMNQLEWRRGKPKVTYCCTYGMTQCSNTNVNLTLNMKENINAIYVILDINQNARFGLYSDRTLYLYYVEYEANNSILRILFNIMDHFVSSSEIKLKKYSVGLLSSILQKCIRHGRCSKEILEDTIRKLARAKPYNLPDQQFLKVSGSRQLFWRFFISIIEDFRYYYDSSNINLFDILVLALITNKEPDYIINDKLMNRMIELGNMVCMADKITDYYEWRDYNMIIPKYDINNNIHMNIIYLAFNFIPKMQGDNVMIQKYYDLLTKYQPKPITINIDKVECNKCMNGMTPIYTGVDNHSVPNIILKFQAISRKNYSTQECSSLIWELNGKFNNRKPKQFIKGMFEGTDIRNITMLQKHYYDEYISIFDIIPFDENNIIKESLVKDRDLTKYDKRILFLKIVGEKIKINPEKFGQKILEVVFSYQDYITNNNMIQIKYINSDEYIIGDDYDINLIRVQNYLKKNRITVNLPDCIIGYNWITDKPVRIGLNDDNMIIVNNIVLNWFDGSSFVKKQENIPYNIPNKKDNMIISEMLSPSKFYDIDCNIECRKIIATRMIDIKDYDMTKHLHILNSIMIKIHTAYDNMVIISQVSRTGERVDNSLDYNYEGKYWKMLNLLHYCYPLALIPSGEMNYKLNINNYHYYRMITDMNIILNKNNDMNNITSIIKTKTKLWDHQLNTVNFILSNIKDGKRGFGDASNVGAGKTLTALATCVELYKNFPYNNKVLILLPSESLIKTWVDEINKHFLGINYIVTKSNGNLEGIYKSDSLNIYITTMGRNRDKKINSKWLFVIIDECLTVQNKEAKQTIAAWEQVICSKLGLLLLSATFFRTRFDKLLYMLKMLNCNLPETKEYLDTILIDSIKVNLPITKRLWHEDMIKIEMSKEFYDKYNKINNSEISNEKKYVELKKYIRDNINYIKLFITYIEKISINPNKKLLIYANSMEEAQDISNISKMDVGLYPDISKRHVVVSYAVGTYGLNNLIAFNHILTRPPEPDKLPQMKGRLDRMGQKENELNITFIMLMNTIEEMEYMKLELCNNFYSNHIMPLSELFNLQS